MPGRRKPRVHSNARCGHCSEAQVQADVGRPWLETSRSRSSPAGPGLATQVTMRRGTWAARPAHTPKPGLQPPVQLGGLHTRARAPTSDSACSSGSSSSYASVPKLRPWARSLRHSSMTSCATAACSAVWKVPAGAGGAQGCSHGGSNVNANCRSTKESDPKSGTAGPTNACLFSVPVKPLHRGHAGVSPGGGGGEGLETCAHAQAVGTGTDAASMPRGCERHPHRCAFASRARCGRYTAGTACGTEDGPVGRYERMPG